MGNCVRSARNTTRVVISRTGAPILPSNSTGWFHKEQEERSMRRAGRVVAICVTLLSGCATTGKRVDVVIPTTSTSGAASASSGSGPRVVVKSFDDARMDRTHLGSRSHFWGDTSYFDLPKGTVGDAVAKALVQQLNKRGWQASLEGNNG